MTKSKCEVRNGRMVACGDLSTDVDTNFDGACQQLLADAAKEPVADLTKVNSLSSTYIGLLAELALGASKSGKRLKIVAGPKISAMLRDAGLSSVAAIENAAEPPKGKR